MCLALVTGMFSGIQVAYMDSALASMKPEERKALHASDADQFVRKALPFCIPTGTITPQLHDILINYLKQHPEDRHLLYEQLFLEALTKTFPCS